MNITKFDKESLKSFSSDVENVLKLVAEKYGVEFDSKGGSYTDLSFKPKFVFLTKSERGYNQYEQDFLGNPGLLNEFLGKEIMFGKKQRFIGGYDKRKPKWCIRLNDKDGINVSNTTIDTMFRMML